jgi:hypothetical protein
VSSHSNVGQNLDIITGTLNEELREFLRAEVGDEFPDGESQDRESTSW